MRQITALIAGLLVVLAAPSLVDAAGSGGYPVADLNLTQSTTQVGAGGGSVTLRGAGADPGAAVDVYLTLPGGERQVGGSTVLSDGTFVASFAVPTGTAPGTYSGAVVTTVGSTFVRSTFQVVVAASGGLPASGGDSSPLVRLGALAAVLGAAALAFAAKHRHTTA